MAIAMALPVVIPPLDIPVNWLPLPTKYDPEILAELMILLASDPLARYAATLEFP
jgi:hypothetical protein